MPFGDGGKGTSGGFGSGSASAEEEDPASPVVKRAKKEEELAGQIVRQLSSANKKIQAEGQKNLSKNSSILSAATRDKYGLPAKAKEKNLGQKVAGGITGGLGGVIKATGLAPVARFLGGGGQAVLQAGRAGAESKGNGFQVGDLGEIAKGFGRGLKTAVDPNAKTITPTEAVNGEGAEAHGFLANVADFGLGAVADPTTYVGLGTSSAAKGALRSTARAGEHAAVVEAEHVAAQAAAREAAAAAERVAAAEARHTASQAALEAIEKKPLAQFLEEGGNKAGERFAAEKAAAATQAEVIAARAAHDAAKVATPIDHAAAQAAGRELAAQVRREGITEANRESVRAALTKAAEDRAAELAEKAGAESVYVGKGGIEKTIERQMKVLEREAKGGIGVLGRKTGVLASSKIPGVDNALRTVIAGHAANVLAKTSIGSHALDIGQGAKDALKTRGKIIRQHGDVVAGDVGQTFARGRGVSSLEMHDAEKALTSVHKKARLSKGDILHVTEAIEQGTVDALEPRLQKIARTDLEVIAKGSSTQAPGVALFDEAIPGAENIRQLPTVFTKEARRHIAKAGLSEPEMRDLLEEGAKVSDSLPTEGSLFDPNQVKQAAPITIAEREAKMRSILADKGIHNISPNALVENNAAVIALEQARVGGERKAISQVLDELKDVRTPDGVKLVSDVPQKGFNEMTVEINKVPHKIHVDPSIEPEIKALSRYLNDDRAVRAATRAYDQVNNMFKGLATVPVFAPLIEGAHFLGLGFHMRNNQGNIIVNSFEGVRPSSYAYAIRSYLKEGTGKLGKLDEESRFLRLARKEDIVGSEANIGDFIGRANTSARRKVGAQSATRTRGILRSAAEQTKAAFDPTAGGTAIGAGRKLGTFVEDISKLAHFKSMLDRGLSPADAAMSVKRSLFDYEDLTEFERRVLKRTIPFYTYMRKNIPLQVKTLAEHPGYLNMENRAQGILTRDKRDDEITPGYSDANGERVVKDEFKGFFGGNGANPITFRWDTPLQAAADALGPYVDLISLVPGTPGHKNANAQEAIKNLMNLPGGGPIGIGRALTNIAYGKDMFSGGKVEVKNGGDVFQLMYNAVQPTAGKVDRSKDEALAKKILGLQGHKVTDQQKTNEIIHRIEVMRALNESEGVETLEEERKSGAAPKIDRSSGGFGSGR